MIVASVAILAACVVALSLGLGSNPNDAIPFGEGVVGLNLRLPAPTGPVDEERIVDDIFANYSALVRPVENVGQKVTVFVGLNLVQIFDLDEKNQVLFANCWVDMEWSDAYVRWQPSNYNGLEVIRLFATSLWIPDIVLYNNADEYKQNNVLPRAMVRHDGTVILPLPVKIHSSCEIDITYFPFDEQICRLKYGSWSYSSWRVDITNRTEGIDISNYVTNGDWDVIGLYQQRHLVHYSCCSEPYSDLTFYIHLRRKSLYYLLNVFFPSGIMSAMTVLVFLVPATSNQKVTLGITTLLSYSVFTLAIVRKLPESSAYLPLLSIYLSSVLAITSLSILNTVIILNLHHRSLLTVSPLPGKLRKFFFRFVGPLICLDDPSPKPEEKPTAPSDDPSPEPEEKPTAPSDDQPNKIQKILSCFRFRRSTPQKREATKGRRGDKTRVKSCRGLGPRVDLVELLVSCGVEETEELRTFAELRSIVRSLSEMARRQELLASRTKLLAQWQHLACIVDRLLFIFFSIVTFLMTVFLVFGPSNLQPNLVIDTSPF